MRFNPENRDPRAKVMFSLRLREELRRRIEAAARDDRRSINEMIVRCLERAFQPDQPIQPAE